jgi:hypothetical protein
MYWRFGLLCSNSKAILLLGMCVIASEDVAVEPIVVATAIGEELAKVVRPNAFFINL